MKRSYLLIIVFHVATLKAQKPIIDTVAFKNWPFIGDAKISNDGGYVMYTVNNHPLNRSTLVLKSLRKNKVIELVDASDADFTTDSKTALARIKDSLFLITLDRLTFRCISNVSSFRLIRRRGGDLIAYKIGVKLFLRDVKENSTVSFDSVINYFISDNENVLLLQTCEKKDSLYRTSLGWLNLTNNKLVNICESIGSKANVTNVIFDRYASQVTFGFSGYAPEHGDNTFWYYKYGAERAIRLSLSDSGSADSINIDHILSFSKDGARLFVALGGQKVALKDDRGVRAQLWSYHDSRLPTQSEMWTSTATYLGMFEIDSRRFIRLSHENETYTFSHFDNRSDDYVIINHIQRDRFTNGNIESKLGDRVTQYIVSTNDGNRRYIRELSYGIDGSYISPNGDYFLYYDPVRHAFLSYSMRSGACVDITKGISSNWIQYGADDPLTSIKIYPIVGWIKDESAALLRDQYDIWKVDLSGAHKPVNITKGYGRKNNIEFSLAIDYSKGVVDGKKQILLSAFDRKSKNNGFYSTYLRTLGNPKKLTMGPYIYNTSFSASVPLKALNADIYLVRRQSASEAVNLFLTKDFTSFTPVTDVFPERRYNWLTSELLEWSGLDGRSCQGILYKPENFDKNRRYPVIFHYYEKKSDYLNEYHRPSAMADEINIPYFVSQGYLICVPDIYYKEGEPGESAVNSVLSAARYLSRKSWVDSTKMGIQGHSFGGYETNFIITRTNVFAAAMSSSGLCNLISGYGSIAPFNGGELQFFYETGQFRIGATLWQKPYLYIKNSPLFDADKISTPLLMMNNKNDGIVPFAQGIEFFLALRRLGKKVWMLQYDNGFHSLVPGSQDAINHTIYVTQFFDHYLKGVPAPLWMMKK